MIANNPNLKVVVAEFPPKADPCPVRCLLSNGVNLRHDTLLKIVEQARLLPGVCLPMALR